MFKNGLYNVLVGIVRALSSFISIPILVHQMGIQDYGVWALVSSILGILTFAEAGLPICAIVYISRDLSNGNNQDLSRTLTIIFSLILIISSISCLFLYYFSSHLSGFFNTFEESQMKTVSIALKISSFSVWLQLIQQVFIGIEQAYQQYVICCISSALQLASLTIGWILLSLIGFGVIEFVWWLNLISLISFVFHASLVTRLIKIRNLKFSWNLIKAKEIIHFSLLSWITVIGRTLFSRGDRLIVASVLGAEKLSIYSILMDFSVMISAFSSMVIQPLTPIISNELASLKPNQDKMYSIIQKAVRYNFLSVLLLSISMLLFSSLILKLCGESVLSQENLLAFRSSISIISIISLNAIGYWILFATRKIQVSAINQLMFGSLSLILIYFCSYRFGLIGAVVGNIGYVGTLSLSFIGLKLMKVKVYQLFGYLVIVSTVTSSLLLFLTVVRI